MTTPPPPSSLHLKPPALPLPTPSIPPLLLTIRFSAALPDLELDIPRPSSTTVISLKHLIRPRLSEPNARRRLRFIHGGKILPDSAVLSSVLRAPPPPPPSPRTPSFQLQHQHQHHDPNSNTPTSNTTTGTGKGKSIPGRPEPPQRIYINCSIGDSLSPSELATEATAAKAPPTTTTTTTSLTSQLTPGGSPLPSPGTPARSTTAAPRGFDRLLQAGFSAAEVNALRLQFRSVHASRYTPDAMPSPDGFRRMEDAWIDDNGASMPTALTASTGGGLAGVGGGGGGGGGGGAGTDSDDVGLVAMVDVMIRGVVTGFVWPLGSAGWLIREEGMASGRWRFMVGVGVMFSMLIGIIRTISGEK
ncbi:DUF2407 C-terminal domain-containing protein [Whalleya microplaca]|nr:DUF2407 C-terminal domain-containing protein [Whalleya microplaca]